MFPFLLRRLVAAVPVLFGVSLLAFSMTHLTPGDPVAIMLGERATAEDVARLRTELGLDRPLPVQYGTFLVRALRGDLGTSLRSGQPVAREIADRVGATAALTFAAMGVAVVVGVLLGTLAAIQRSPLVDAVIMSIALVGISMPTFWSGLLLILLFALTLGWFPITASGGAGLVLPAVTLGLPAAAVLARLTRSALLEVLGQDFIRTARAKGLFGRGVVLKHALRNALVPVVTVIGLQFGSLLAGAVITETVFTWPGIGSLLVQSILARDYPVVQGAVLLIAVSFIIVNLIVDLIYGYVDPRIRYD